MKPLHVFSSASEGAGTFDTYHFLTQVSKPLSSKMEQSMDVKSNSFSHFPLLALSLSLSFYLSLSFFFAQTNTSFCIVNEVHNGVFLYYHFNKMFHCIIFIFFIFNDHNCITNHINKNKNKMITRSVRRSDPSCNIIATGH